MKLHDLQSRNRARRTSKRVGRGIAAGQGKTAGRGTKGQGARTGSGGNLYRQGGNLPFFRRLPFKRGFTNINRKYWSEVNIGRLDLFDEGTEITPALLHAAGLIRDEGDPVVVLGHGKLKKALTIQAHRVTSGARAAIEKAGGSVKLLDP
ncbi:MAG: 50S ribosomal protein L15 [Anaerolineae bacterium]|nr:MAG: 50S ribosomal protein L15 [Anaerolineae bacterium]